MTLDLALTYLDFVSERHRIWEQRQAGDPQPWADDLILASKKFTNVYRVLDYGSQFLLGMLNELDDPKEQLARAFLYRHTGRPEPWEFFELMHGRYPLLADLDLARDTWRTYRGETRPHTSGGNRAGQTSRVGSPHDRPVFTGAYMVFPQSQTPGTDKLDSIIELTRKVFSNGSWEKFEAATTQTARFDALRANPGVADFMSMQILTDFGYTTEDRENVFVTPGPGAIRGAEHLFPKQDPVATIRWARLQLLSLDGCPDLGGRPPSLMDIQNTLCEFSKYVRYMDKPVGKPYTPSHPGPQPAPLLPKDWT